MTELVNIPKDELLNKIKAVMGRGWVTTQRPKNDGAVGNTLEDLLNIPENNLAIANTVDWELKAQRINTKSLTTLFHMDPQPRKPLTFVAQHLLPTLGWRHKEAGVKYPKSELSFRATLTGSKFTDRGISIEVDSVKSRVELQLDFHKTDSKHKKWLKKVQDKIGDRTNFPIAYWTFEELQKKCAGKIKNTIYVLADSKIVDGFENFYYVELWLLEDFVFNNFLKGIINGKVFVDFDARTGHNHGTKFRVFRKDWPMLFSKVTRVA